MAPSLTPRWDPDDPSFRPTDPELRPPRRRLWAKWLAVAVGLLLVIGLGLRLALGRDPVRTRLFEALRARLPGLELLGPARLDWLGRVKLGPLRERGEDGRTLLTIDGLTVRPGYRALLAGRVEAASVRMGTVVVEAGARGEGLSALVKAVERAPHEGPGESAGHGRHTPVPYLRVDRLELHVSEPGETPRAVTLLDLRLKVQREEGLSAQGSAELEGGGEISVALTRSPGAPMALDADVAGVGPGAIPAWVAERLPFRIDAGRFSARLQTISAGLARGSMRLTARMDGLTLEGARLADGPLGPLALGFTGSLRWDAPHRRLILEDGALSVGEGRQLTAGLSADVQLAGEPHLRASAELDKLAFPAALAALPPSLQPPVEAPHVQGTLDAALSLEGPLREPDDWKLEAKLDLSRLKPLSDSRALDLHGDFEYRTADEAGVEHTFWVGPKNPDFVPLAELPVYVWRAVTTSEDAGFFAHHGFDFDELKNSIVADELAGRAVRGGSTITQQLAKNLYLSKEKTYARKLREAFATLALEASYPKQRLLEIYLNVIEWGPGIYGIGQAAKHYFGKDARQLTPKEAAFLATIIPNPIRFSIYYERGALTENWEARLDDLLDKMHALGYLTDEEHLDAVMLPLAFAKPEPSPAAAPPVKGGQASKPGDEHPGGR